MDGVNTDAVIAHKDMEFQWEAHGQLPERSNKERLLVTHLSVPSASQIPSDAPQVYEPSPTPRAPKPPGPKG